MSIYESILQLYYHDIDGLSYNFCTCSLSQHQTFCRISYNIDQFSCCMNLVFFSLYCNLGGCGFMSLWGELFSASKIACLKNSPALEYNCHQICNIRPTKTQSLIVSPSSSCLGANYGKQALSREWRCSWSSADRRCSNYIWVLNKFITY